MKRKYILWGVFIAVLILILILIFALNRNNQEIANNDKDKSTDNAETLYEDQYTKNASITNNSTNISIEENNSITTSSTNLDIYEINKSTPPSTNIDSVEKITNYSTESNISNNITTDDNTKNEISKESTNSTKNIIEKKEIKLNFYITSNIKGDFTTYDYDYDKKDYDGSFTQLAKLINDNVKKDDYLINVGDTFSTNQSTDTIYSFSKAFNELKYDLWVLSEDDYKKTKDVNFDKSRLLTPDSSKTLDNLIIYNQYNGNLDNALNIINLSFDKKQNENILTISNTYDNSKKDITLDNSTKNLYKIEYDISELNNDFTTKSTITKIPVKDDNRVILPLHNISNLFKNYHDESINDLEKIIGQVVNGDFFGEKGLDQIDSYWLEPTKLTDLINEVQLYYANQMIDEEVKISSTPIYVENLDLSNDISKRYINRFYPEKNSLYIVKMTGKQLKEYLEWSVEFYNKFEKDNLTITRTNKPYNLYDIFKGINYEINIGNDFGNRIENLTDYSSNTIKNEKEYLLVTNSDRVENQFSNIGEIFKDKLPKIITSSKNSNKYKNYYMSNFIEEYIKDVKNGIIKSKTDENWEIIGTNWNKINRIKAEKIFKEGNLEINNKVPLNYEDIKDLAEKIILKYTVKSGDWLLKISRIYGVSYKEIAEKNNIKDPDLIYPNQVFIIPEK